MSNAFFQSVAADAVIMVDDVERSYAHNDKEKMLTLLDGVYPSKKLFILTCNDKWRVNEHMRNRPGRIYYMLDYKGLEHNFIEEYCADNLKAQEHIPTVCRIATLFDQFNFDMLKAIVEEMNRYGETPQEVMKMLNSRPEFSGVIRYAVALQVKGLDIPEADADTEWTGNPLSEPITVNFKEYDPEGDYLWSSTKFNTDDLKQVDAQGGKFVFMNAKGDRVVLSKTKERSFHWGAF